MNKKSCDTCKHFDSTNKEPCFVPPCTVINGLKNWEPKIDMTDHAEELANLGPTSYQIGGSHYKATEIQPIEFFCANSTREQIMGAMRKDITKYIWRDKNGLEDLEKAQHLLEIYVEALGEKRDE